MAAWYEEARHPGLALTALVFVLYGASLLGGFVLDDLRNLQLFREYHDGARESLDLYRFLAGGEENRTLREAGWCPWWVQDELRYQHFRPAAEHFLYWQYLVFGTCALGYRVVSLVLYALAVRLILELFRLISRNERMSRWGAMLFAVAACHAIPVTFIAEQCDVIALVLAGGALLLAGRFVEGGGGSRLGLALFLYAAGLLAKEVVLPVALLPLCLGLVLRGEAGARRRSIVCAGCFMLAGLLWLGFYVAGGYGSNAMMMLDPFHGPWAYLAALPGRALLLLSTWIIPVNPFLLLFHHEWGRWLPAYGLLGGALLTMLAVMYWRRHRSDRGVVVMALCVLSFIPLLVCTPPDDRVMMLPSIGFAYLGAVWMTRPRRDGSARLQTLPFALFVVIQVGVVVATPQVLQFMELEARKHLRAMVATFERRPKPGDHIFFLNTARNFEALSAQDRLRWIQGTDDTKVSVLSDVARPRIEVVDERMLRLEAQDAPFFSSFVGLMGTARDRPRREGDVIGTGEVEGRVMKVEDGAVLAVELRFRKPVTAESYRFFWSDSNKPPKLWRVQDDLDPSWVNVRK